MISSLQAKRPGTGSLSPSQLFNPQRQQRRETGSDSTPRYVPAPKDSQNVGDGDESSNAGQNERRDRNGNENGNESRSADGDGDAAEDIVVMREDRQHARRAARARRNMSGNGIVQNVNGNIQSVSRNGNVSQIMRGNMQSMNQCMIQSITNGDGSSNRIQSITSSNRNGNGNNVSVNVNARGGAVSVNVSASGGGNVSVNVST